jgi:tRNA-splicing ligase RtcB
MKEQLSEKITIWNEHDENTIKQIKTCAEHEAVVRAAVCADGHMGYAVPIGGVVAYEEHISPSGVGFDIGCGNKAVLLDIPAREVKQKIKKIMDDVWKNLSFGMGRNNEERVDHEIFEDERWKRQPFKHYKQMAQNQLGTIGSGVCRLLS